MAGFVTHGSSQVPDEPDMTRIPPSSPYQQMSAHDSRQASPQPDSPPPAGGQTGPSHTRRPYSPGESRYRRSLERLLPPERGRLRESAHAYAVDPELHEIGLGVLRFDLALTDEQDAILAAGIRELREADLVMAVRSPYPGGGQGRIDYDPDLRNVYEFEFRHKSDDYELSMRCAGERITDLSLWRRRDGLSELIVHAPDDETRAAPSEARVAAPGREAVQKGKRKASAPLSEASDTDAGPARGARAKGKGKERSSVPPHGTRVDTPALSDDEDDAMVQAVMTASRLSRPDLDTAAGEGPSGADYSRARETRTKDILRQIMKHARRHRETGRGRELDHYGYSSAADLAELSNACDVHPNAIDLGDRIYRYENMLLKNGSRANVYRALDSEDIPRSFRISLETDDYRNSEEEILDAMHVSQRYGRRPPLSGEFGAKRLGESQPVTTGAHCPWNGRSRSNFYKKHKQEFIDHGYTMAMHLNALLAALEDRAANTQPTALIEANVTTRTGRTVEAAAYRVEGINYGLWLRREGESLEFFSARAREGARRIQGSRSMKQASTTMNLDVARNVASRRSVLSTLLDRRCCNSDIRSISAACDRATAEGNYIDEGNGITSHSLHLDIEGTSLDIGVARLVRNGAVLDMEIYEEDGKEAAVARLRAKHGIDA